MKKSLICAGGGGFLWGMLVASGGRVLGVPMGWQILILIIGAFIGATASVWLDEKGSR